MRFPHVIRGIAFTFVVTLGIVSAQLGPKVESLQREIQGKERDEVRALIIRRLGPPAREVGSGFQIEQWDVDGGVLTFHPLTGPTFKKAGVTTRLIHTNNPAGLCLLGSYEMTTKPESPHGMRYWLGDLVLSKDSYTFRDSNDNLDHRQDQRHNFFMRHPSGRIVMKYSGTVKPTTRLEDLADGSTVATVTFVAQGVKRTYRIVTSRTEMSLRFEAKDVPVEMQKQWVNYWH